MRQLCNPQAVTISRSEYPCLVLRSTSFTLRLRFTPDSVCSTRTRKLDSTLFNQTSAALNGLPFGFFSVVVPPLPWGYSLESRCLYSR